MARGIRREARMRGAGLGSNTPGHRQCVCNWWLWQPQWPVTLAYFARGLISPIEIENNSNCGHGLERP